MAGTTLWGGPLACEPAILPAYVGGSPDKPSGHSARKQDCSPHPAARELDQVYLTARYPNGFASGAPADYFTNGTSERFIEDARTIVEFCRSAIH